MDVEIQGIGRIVAGRPSRQAQVRTEATDQVGTGTNPNRTVGTPVAHGRNGEPSVKKTEGNRKEGKLGQVRQVWQYNSIKECNEEYGDPVEFGCTYFHVSRSAYYVWLFGKPSKRGQENQQIAEKVEQIHMQHPDKGYRRIRDDLEHDFGIMVRWRGSGAS